VKNHVTPFYRIITWCYLSFPITYITVMALLFDITPRRCVSIVFSPFYLLLSILAVAAGIGMREVRHWAWYAFLSLNLLLVYENLMLVQYGDSAFWGPAYLFSVLLLFLLSYRVSRELVVPWVIPKIRWWESDPRHKMQVKARVLRGENDDAIQVEILDLDYGGCFVRTRTRFEADERVKLHFSVFGLEVVCPGFVVLRVDSAVTHPQGIGVKFVHHSRGMRKRMKLIHARVRAINGLYRTARYILGPEEYFKALRQLQESPIIMPEASSARLFGGGRK
jgi:hypothetical protein